MPTEKFSFQIRSLKPGSDCRSVTIPAKKRKGEKRSQAFLNGHSLVFLFALFLSTLVGTETQIAGGREYGHCLRLVKRLKKSYPTVMKLAEYPCFQLHLREMKNKFRKIHDLNSTNLKKKKKLN